MIRCALGSVALDSFLCQDVKFYKALREDIGEAVPPIVTDDPDAPLACPHRFLVPNVNRTACVLPGRIDIGRSVAWQGTITSKHIFSLPCSSPRHYILTGGLHGHRETHDRLVSRVLSFGRYIFNPADYPVIRDLFSRDNFQAAARAVCPADQQTLDPFQFNLIVQVPGQTVPLHIDAPYFWGASRFEFPQWLLAAMVFSNLFKDRFINQVQVVAYFHEWNDVDVRSGNFAYFPEGSKNPKQLLARPRAGSIIDGSKTVHAADVYLPESKPPVLDQAKRNALELVDDEVGGWKLTSENQTVRHYKDDELRWTVVYRARCFASEAERTRYHESTERISFEDIVGVFEQDLIKRGSLSKAGDALAMDRLQFALLLLDTYVAYPFGDAVVPLNYCALTKVWPKAYIFLKYFCN